MQYRKGSFYTYYLEATLEFCNNSDKVGCRYLEQVLLKSNFFAFHTRYKLGTYKVYEAGVLDNFR